MKVCPMNIGISATFAAMNMFTLYKNLERAKRSEGFNVVNAGKKRANECIGCGQCEEACPQHIEIRKHLAEVAEAFQM